VRSVALCRFVIIVRRTFLFLFLFGSIVVIYNPMVRLVIIDHYRLDWLWFRHDRLYFRFRDYDRFGCGDDWFRCRSDWFDFGSDRVNHNILRSDRLHYGLGLDNLRAYWVDNNVLRILLPGNLNWLDLGYRDNIDWLNKSSLFFLLCNLSFMFPPVAYFSISIKSILSSFILRSISDSSFLL
jgi:hypothetical protein